MKFLNTLIGFFLLLTINTAFARTPVQIVNYDNIAITTGTGKKLDNDQIQQAIAIAAVQREWTTAASGPNSLEATLNVRGKHTVVVNISWTQDAFNIHYKNTINLGYVEQNGVALIHPFYNKWIATLRDDIAREFLKR